MISATCMYHILFNQVTGSRLIDTFEYISLFGHIVNQLCVSNWLSWTQIYVT